MKAKTALEWTLVVGHDLYAALNASLENKT